MKQLNWVKSGLTLAMAGALAASFVSCQPSNNAPPKFKLADELNITKPGMPLVKLQGLGTKGAYINVLVDDTQFGRVGVGEDGKWLIDRALPPGQYKVKIVELNQADEPVATYGPYSLSVGQKSVVAEDKKEVPAESKPTESKIADKAKPEPPKVSETPAVPTQKPVAEKPLTGGAMLADLKPYQKVKAGAFVIKGQDAVNSVIEIYLDGKFVAGTRSDAAGDWKQKLRLTAGKRVISVRSRAGGKGVVRTLEVVK